MTLLALLLALAQQGGQPTTPAFRSRARTTRGPSEADQ
jgi:hypothetical protein